MSLIYFMLLLLWLIIVTRYIFLGFLKSFSFLLFRSVLFLSCSHPMSLRLDSDIDFLFLSSYIPTTQRQVRWL